MNFSLINKDEYKEFASKHPLRDILQTTEMEEISSQKNCPSYYVGVKQDGKLIGASRLVAIKNRIGQNYFYAPRGPLLDYNNYELLKFFTKKVKEFVRKNKGYVLHIDPLVIHKERNIDGDIVEDGINNEKIITNLKELGYIHKGFNTAYNLSGQVRWTFCMNIKDKSIDEVFSNMKQNHRNIIRKTEKFGIIIKEANYDELTNFKKITEDTSERRSFNDKPLSYYQKMYELFKGRVKFLIAYIDTSFYLDSLNKEISIEQDKYDKAILIDSNSGRVKELKVTIDSLNKRIIEAKEMVKKGKLIPLSAAMFMLYEKEVIYLFSGSYKEYMHFYAQYAIQWYMIKYAVTNKFEKYNFYGITGNFDKSDPEYGVYEFKKGFGGYVEEYIGDFDLPVTYFYKIKKLFKWFWKNVTFVIY